MKRGSFYLIGLAGGLGLFLVLFSPLLTSLREKIALGVHVQHSAPSQDLTMQYQLLMAANQQLEQLYQQELFLNRALTYALQLEENTKDDYIQKRHKELKGQLKKLICAIPASFCGHEMTYWSAGGWINVGKKENIQENSPVVWRNCIVGVVERVCEEKSWVRLILDPALTPAVRTARGMPQLRQAEIELETALRHIHLTPTLEGREPLLRQLSDVLASLEIPKEGQCLAKGYLQAASSPLWRSPGRWLEGIGFNYDFDDEEGPARPLRDGLQDKNPKLIQIGDLLITTGLDGVFPPGWVVGEVTMIDPLEEGATSYTLKARPLAPLEDPCLQVFVLPPLH